MPALAWFRSIPDSARLCFCRMNQLGFLRLLTMKQIKTAEEVRRQREARKFLDDLREDDQIVFIDEPAGLETTFRSASRMYRTAPKDWADSYLIAFAQAACFQLVTFDRVMSRKGVGPFCLVLLDDLCHATRHFLLIANGQLHVVDVSGAVLTAILIGKRAEEELWAAAGEFKIEASGAAIQDRNVVLGIETSHCSRGIRHQSGCAYNLRGIAPRKKRQNQDVALRVCVNYLRRDFSKINPAAGVSTRLPSTNSGTS